MAVAAQLAVVGMLLLSCTFAAGQGSKKDSEERCQTAIQAQQFALDQFAQMGGQVDEDSYVNEDLTMLLGMQFGALRQASSVPSKDLYMPFLEEPYVHWGNNRVQAIMSASVYVPSANIGEVMYAVSNITAGLALLPDEDKAQDTTETSELWSNAWYNLADHVLDGVGGKRCKGTTDDLSCRSAMLRHLNYVFAGQYANPMSSESVSRLQEAADLFDNVMADFENFHTDVYTTTFDNGTATAELRTLFAGPKGTRTPTLVMWVPVSWVLEVAYMRYGIGALRRGYSLLIFEGPGGGMTPRVPPFMPSYHDTAEVLRAVLDEAAARDDTGDILHPERLVLFGLETSSFSIGQACTAGGLGKDYNVAACVMSPPLPSQMRARRARLVEAFWGPFVNLSIDQPELFPSPELAATFADVEASVYEPLVLECDEGSGAPQVFSPIFSTTGLLPDALYPVLTALGGAEGDPQTMLDSSWQAWRRAEQVEEPWEPADIDVPVFFTHGADDREYIGDSTQEVFDAMPAAVRKGSTTVTFGEETGGALPGQRGATPVYEEELYPFLLRALDDDRRRR